MTGAHESLLLFMVQRQIATTLYRTKYEEDVTREELSLLKQRMTGYHPSPWTLPFEAAAFPVQHESDAERQRRADQFGDIGRRACEKILMLSVTCAEAQYSRCHKEHNDQVRQMWQEQQRSAPMHRALSPRMIDLIEQRFHNIDQRVKCVTMHKTRRSQLNAAVK